MRMHPSHWHCLMCFCTWTSSSSIRFIYIYIIYYIYMQLVIQHTWLWVKKKILGDHRFWSILILPIGFFRYPFLTHTHMFFSVSVCVCAQKVASRKEHLTKPPSVSGTDLNLHLDDAILDLNLDCKPQFKKLQVSQHLDNLDSKGSALYL